MTGSCSSLKEDGLQFNQIPLLSGAFHQQICCLWRMGTDLTDVV